MAQIGCATGSILVDSTNRYNSSIPVQNNNNISNATKDTNTQVNPSKQIETVTSPPGQSNGDDKVPVVNIIPAETTSSLIFQFPTVDLTGLDNEVLVRYSIGLYKTSNNPVTGGTIVVDFGYMQIGKLFPIPTFKPYNSCHITVPSDFNDICYTKAFYNSEFGKDIVPNFDFINGKVCRLDYIHQMYDYLAYSNPNSTYFNDIIENFAIRVYGINTNNKEIGVAAGIVYF